MIKYILLFLLIPTMVSAQNNSATNSQNIVPQGYTINGTLTGFEDGVTVSLLNGNNGKPELNTQLKDGKFSFTGKIDNPDFRLIAVNNQPPYITLFLDNSQVQVVSDKSSFENATVNGSTSHKDFMAFNAVIQPYDALINGTEQVTDFKIFEQASDKIADFITSHKASYISPLAIYRLHQFTANGAQMASLFNQLNKEVKLSPIGVYLDQQITANNNVPIGKPLADFSQEDTLGNSISLSSLKGKYVLVDFWASWCRPCRDENPNVVNMFNRFKDKNFTVLGVSLDKSKEAWVKAIHQDNLTWAHVSDLKGWQNEVAAQFNITSIPQNYLIDPQGNIIAKNLRGVALQYKLNQLLK